MSQSDQQVFQKRRRVPRARVDKRMRGVFLTCKALSDKPFKVIEIGELGAGIISHRILEKTPMGVYHHAQLTVGYSSINIKVRVVYASKDRAGVEFVEFLGDEQFQRGLIRNFFRDEFEASAIMSQAPKGLA